MQIKPRVRQRGRSCSSHDRLRQWLSYDCIESLLLFTDHSKVDPFKSHGLVDFQHVSKNCCLQWFFINVSKLKSRGHRVLTSKPQSPPLYMQSSSQVVTWVSALEAVWALQTYLSEGPTGYKLLKLLLCLQFSFLSSLFWGRWYCTTL